MDFVGNHLSIPILQLQQVAEIPLFLQEQFFRMPTFLDLMPQLLVRLCRSGGTFCDRSFKFLLGFAQRSLVIGRYALERLAVGRNDFGCLATEAFCLSMVAFSANSYRGKLRRPDGPTGIV